MLQRLRPAYSENCTITGQLDVVAGEVFRWLKSTSRGKGEIGFSQKREKGHQEQTPKGGLCWNCRIQYSSHALY